VIQAAHDEQHATSRVVNYKLELKPQVQFTVQSRVS